MTAGAMPGHVMAVVLLAALLHASWNALVKAGRNAFLTTVLVASGAGLLGAAALAVLGLPAAASWPWALASTIIHFFYFGFLAAAYRHGDMSHSYPLMRGSAPLLVAIASMPLLGETPGPVQWLSVACICGGILSMYSAGGGARATGFALLNALAIAAYTLVDAVGVRLSGQPAAYTMLLFAQAGAGLLAWTAVRQPQALAGYARRHWPVALLGGAGSLASYGLALWAMTRAPVAAVAALRETAILFAALIAALFLGERIGKRRAAAIAMIAGGAALMRLA